MKRIMKTGLKIGLGVLAAALLVVIGLGAGWVLWGRRLWLPGLMGRLGTMWNTAGCAGQPAASGCTPTNGNRGFGMMGRRSGPGPLCGNQGSTSPRGCSFAGASVPSTASESISIAQARQAVETYLQDSGYSRLEIDELMEFELNYYALVKERDTGIGAMELLVDKTTGAVGPEMGPNMMWNARYGMHRRGMMMGSSGKNAVTDQEALKLAQQWLAANRPGVTTEDHADPFYGYYTVHTMKDGQIEGMLSVHGTTGQIWYHTWHGAFVQQEQL